jgi:hypothetical protein
VKLVWWLAAALCAAQLVVVAQSSAGASKGAPYRAPRNKYGQPDFGGIWMARNTAHGDLEAHTASYGIRAGNSVVVDPPDGRIPYTPEARKRREENYKNRLTADPLNKCYLPGVPRVMYLPYPLQFFQTPHQISIASEYAHTIRHVYLNNKGHYKEAEFWMGDSRGRWEGDTLVIDSANFNAETWLDQSGNHHSEQLRVVERIRRVADDVLLYEATLTDPAVYTRPWTIRMNLYRDREPNAQLFEYECHVYLEDEGLLKR